jgi:hypothetical protein
MPPRRHARRFCGAHVLDHRIERQMVPANRRKGAPTDLRGGHELTWDESLRPVGESTADKETFDTWWSRNRDKLDWLDSRIVEQWIYRHWQHSPYCNLPLERLSFRLERWSTARLLASVTRPDPDSDQALLHDYDLYRDRTWEPAPSMRENGTWNIPIILLETPSGALRPEGFRADVRFVLIEGHQRMRCLAAFSRHAKCADAHEVFVLKLGQRRRQHR